MERFLYRLSRSANADSFVLKGALLFRVWDVPDSRATRDIDFLAYVDNSPENLAAIFREVCKIDDRFKTESVIGMDQNIHGQSQYRNHKAQGTKSHAESALADI